MIVIVIVARLIWKLTLEEMQRRSPMVLERGWFEKGGDGGVGGEGGGRRA